MCTASLSDFRSFDICQAINCTFRRKELSDDNVIPPLVGKVNGGQETEGGSDGGEQDELADNEEDLAESGQEKEASRYAPQWSAAHMTAVAKLPNVIEWLTHVLSDPDSEA